MLTYVIYLIYSTNTAILKLMSKQKILFDANAIIELHQFSLKAVIHACHAAVTPIIRRECRFYKDEQGQKKSIDLSKDISDQKIEEIPIPLEIFNSFHRVLKDPFLEGIDEGEREAIAFLYTSKQKDPYLFCTADQLAIKCLGVLGLRRQGMSMQELFEKLKLKTNLPNRYLQTRSKQHFEKMLNEGFQESHLHKK